MNKRANAALIGGFVTGAIILAIAGILVFGSGKLFSEKQEFVLFFSESVTGLRTGAPVDFKGVKIGTVTEVNVILKRDDLSPRIPVFIQLEPGRFKVDCSVEELRQLAVTKGSNDFTELLIKQGLRAQLQMQSLVTGQLAVHLDFFPDKPVKLVGVETRVPEIPTIESGLSELARTVQQLPLSDIAEKALKVLSGLDTVVNSPDLKEVVATANQTLKTANELLAHVKGRVDPLADSADLTMKDARTLLANATLLSKNLDERIPRLVNSLEDTSKTAGAAMKDAQHTINSFGGETSPVRVELLKALNEVSGAARSLRVLAQYLESHPEALVRGKAK